MNRRPDKMEDLLMNKKYQELLPEEKEWIDRQYSSEEYNAMRTVLIEGTAFFQKEQTSPNPEIKSKLRQKLKQVKEPAKVSPLFLYRIPAWQAIAAFALFLFFIPQIQDKQASDPDKIFIYQTDTVFKEVPVETIFSPILDTLTDIPQVRKILNRTNRSPIKASTVVFSKDSAIGSGLSQTVSDYFASNYDTTSVESVIGRYLKDSVKSYRVDVDTGFQNLGRVY